MKQLFRVYSAQEFWQQAVAKFEAGIMPPINLMSRPRVIAANLLEAIGAELTA